MDYLELLCAAEVRKLAVKLAHKAYNELEKQLGDDPNKDTKLAAWEEQHTADDFLEEAYLQIVGIAKQVGMFERTRIQRVLEGSKYAPQKPPTSPA